MCAHNVLVLLQTLDDRKFFQFVIVAVTFRKLQLSSSSIYRVIVKCDTFERIILHEKVMSLLIILQWLVFKIRGVNHLLKIDNLNKGSVSIALFLPIINESSLFTNSKPPSFGHPVPWKLGLDPWASGIILDVYNKFSLPNQTVFCSAQGHFSIKVNFAMRALEGRSCTELLENNIELTKLFCAFSSFWKLQFCNMSGLELALLFYSAS